MGLHLANKRSNPLHRLVLLYLLHLLHRLQELYLPLERRLYLSVVRGKLGSFRTGGQANDDITTKKECTRKRGTKSVLFYCVLLLFKPRYIFLNKLQFELCYFSYLFLFVRHHRPSAEKSQVYVYPGECWFSGSRLHGENDEQTSQTGKVFT